MVLYLFSALWASSELWGLGAGVEGVNGAIMESSSFEAEIQVPTAGPPLLGGALPPHLPPASHGARTALGLFRQSL